MKQSPSEQNFHLAYCERCVQMTNHLLGVCQKCKVESPSEEGKESLLKEIDELLAFLENAAHGEEGRQITSMRGKIQSKLEKSDQEALANAWEKGANCWQEMYNWYERGQPQPKNPFRED